jgi:peptidoglycan-associated lipoprotein
MNRTSNLLLLAALLSLTVVGCRHRPVGVTRIPERPPEPIVDTTPAPPIVPPEGVVGANPGSNIPLNERNAHEGWIENRESFKAQTVHFDFDSSSVKANERSKVEMVASQLKTRVANAVKIEGHCDERGTEEYNRALGERRALALREELVRLGVEPHRIDTISYGEDRPVAQGHDDAAYRQNRRGEFIELSPPK